MIPKDYVAEWKQQTKWKKYAHAELDLIVTRILVELFDEPLLSQSVAVNGSTAIHKLYLNVHSRISETIELVTIQPERISQIFSIIKEKLELSFGKLLWTIKDGKTILYCPGNNFNDNTSKLSIELHNPCDYCMTYNLCSQNLGINSGWFSGNSKITTYQLDELVATKLCNLYNHMKIHDLYDIWAALHSDILNPTKVIQLFKKYMEISNNIVCNDFFIDKLNTKFVTSENTSEENPLVTSKNKWNKSSAVKIITKQLLMLLY